MSIKQGIGKSTYITLGVGMVVGGLAFASIQEVSTRAHAGPEFTARPISGVTTENMAVLRNLDSTFASLAEYVSPSVVHIKSESKSGTDILGRRMGRTGGEGTGVIFRPDGWIITNDHVVGGFDKVSVVLSDGREFTGQVRRAEDSDIAVVKIEASGLPVAQFGDSSKVKAGQFAMAVGSPFGLENSVTIGHVSAVGRESAVPDARLETGVRFYADLIQTDAAINMGNSGGPLMNVDGQVIGINSAIYSGTGGNVGIGFAIPSNQARLIADMLIEKGTIKRGYMGLSPVNLKPYQKKEMKIETGALVATVENGSPAAMAGIKQGDVITRIGTHQIQSQMDLRNAMLNYLPGSTTTVEYLRNGARKTTSVKVAERPKELVAQKPQSDLQVPDGTSPFDGFRGNEDDLRDLLPKLKENEADVPPLRTGQARLGVSVETLTPELRKQYEVPADVPGAVVVSVEPGSIADKLDLKPGFIIQQIGDKQIRSADDLVDAMKGVKWGDTKVIKFGRFTNNSALSQSLPVEFR